MRSSQKPRKWLEPTSTTTCGRACAMRSRATARPSRKACARSVLTTLSQWVFISVECDAPTPSTIDMLRSSCSTQFSVDESGGTGHVDALFSQSVDAVLRGVLGELAPLQQ